MSSKTKTPTYGAFCSPFFPRSALDCTVALRLHVPLFIHWSWQAVSMSCSMVKPFAHQKDFHSMPEVRLRLSIRYNSPSDPRLSPGPLSPIPLRSKIHSDTESLPCPGSGSNLVRTCLYAKKPSQSSSWLIAAKQRCAFPTSPSDMLLRDASFFRPLFPPLQPYNLAFNSSGGIILTGVNGTCRW